jgi:hypothetical protein
LSDGGSGITVRLLDAISYRKPDFKLAVNLLG